MENTISKQRAEDTDLNAGNKRSKQADGQPPSGEIQPTNELKMEALRPAGMAFIGSDAESRRPREKASIQEYPSIQNINYVHSEDVSIITTSDVTLQSMMRPCTSAGGPVLRVGDIITFRVFGDNIKEIEVRTLFTFSDHRSNGEVMRLVHLSRLLLLFLSQLTTPVHFTSYMAGAGAALALSSSTSSF
ncbi:hypothetical protein DL95DRAFT_468541 [Leptodontidium sp. 2 PMI_412]|nr:hypothetical protein DL95DRAFT_468541 [Leptodontidium sp. 2 PMI_412]